MQLELLKIFKFQLNDEQLTEIRDILAKYFAEKASEEMQILWVKNNWSADTMDEWLGERLHIIS